MTGTELAERLEVSGRTVRADVERLRALGYPVEGLRGPVGGYRLGAGADMPRCSSTTRRRWSSRSPCGRRPPGRSAGSRRRRCALTKLERVLPPRLRRRAAALRAFTVAVRPDAAGPVVDPALLSTLAAACRDHEGIRFEYASHAGAASRREIEPSTTCACWPPATPAPLRTRPDRYRRQTGT